MDIKLVFGTVLFTSLFAIISTEKLNKTVVALGGASIFILTSLISQHKAFEYIDWNVIFLLIGMMIMVGIVRETGLFQFIAIKAARASGGNPFKILVSISIISAIFSALLDNVTTVLILTPIVILIAIELDISPKPFIIAEILTSNIGGTATLIGDPPNIMVGSAAKLSFVDFISNLAPLIFIILIFFLFFAWLLWRNKMHVTNERKARIMEFDEWKFIEDKKLLAKSLSVFFLVLVGFLLHSTLHLEAATIAITGASLLMLLTGEKELHRYFHEIEWETIFFFIGLFILVGGLEEIGIINKLASSLISLTHGDNKIASFTILWSSGIFSGIIDNIPFVATMIPLIKEFGRNIPGIQPQLLTPIWWSLAAGACLGGNATLIGASANVVASGIAKKNGFHITFWTFTKYGFVITIINLIISSFYINFRYF